MLNSDATVGTGDRTRKGAMAQLAGVDLAGVGAGAGAAGLAAESPEDAGVATVDDAAEEPESVEVAGVVVDVVPRLSFL